MSGEVFGLVLDGAGVDPALAGGKGAALDELIGHGFTVPPTGVLTTASSRRFISATGIVVALARLVHHPPDQGDGDGRRGGEPWEWAPPARGRCIGVGRGGCGCPLSGREGADLTDLHRHCPRIPFW